MSWILLSSEGLLSDVLSCRQFAFSEFIGVLGAVMGGCMVVFLGLGGGFGFGQYLHLIPLCGDEFSSFVSCLCFFSHMGVGIGWVGLD